MLLDTKSSPCELIQAHMTALLDDELSQTDASTMRSHIAECAICTQAFEQIQQALKSADAWNAAGSDVWEALEKRIEAEPKARTASAGTQPQSEPLQANRELTAEQLAEALYVHRHKSGEPGRISMPAANIKSADGEGQDDLRAVLTEMRALRTEIQELRGEVGSLRRLLSATRQSAPPKVYRPHSSPQLMPLPLPENSGIGLL